jgi:integral membrane protein (TIGR01906 family)
VTGLVVRVVAAIATILVVVGVGLLPFLTPLWIFPAQARASADLWTGWPIETVHAVTGEVLVDLVVGPPDFDQVVDGEPVLNEREVGHLRDVRAVLLGFTAAVAIAVVVLVVLRSRQRADHADLRGIRAGGVVTVAAIVALGITAAVAFETLFEIFHRIFFASGSYTFDPTTERLVQLFPMDFWFETSIAIGVVILVVAAIVAIIASRRLAALERSPS